MPHTSLVEPHALRARSAASHAAAIAATAAGLQVKMWAFAREWACVAMIPSPIDDPPLLMRATAADVDAGAHAPTIACSAVPFAAAVAAIDARCWSSIDRRASGVRACAPSALQAWWCARSRAARVFSFGSCRIECSTAAGPSGTCQGQQARAAYIGFASDNAGALTILAAREAPPPRTHSAVSRVHWLARLRLPFGSWCTEAGNHEGQVTCLAVVSDDTVFSGSDDCRIKVWGRALCE